jgi:hypothetical protein
MVTVCAWCRKFMGTKEPLGDPVVTHGICATCVLRQRIGVMPTLVIARERADMLPLLEALLTGTPEIRVVVERREGERRASGTAAALERRARNDRRESGSASLA